MIGIRVIGLFFFAGMLAACNPDSASRDSNNRDSTIAETSQINCELHGPFKIDADSSGNFPLIKIRKETKNFCALILPIDRRAIRKIESGEKTFDYRRAHPADRFSHVVYFNTQSSEISGIAEVVGSIAASPIEITKLISNGSGSDQEEILEYFGARKYGFAIEINGFKKFKFPLSLTEARSLNSKFARPTGYIFLERFPLINLEVQRRAFESHDPI